MRRSPFRMMLASGCAVALSLTLVGCGESDEAKSSDTTVEAAGDVDTTAAGDAALAEIEKRGKPEVKVPAAPATELKVTDLVEGKGAEVTAADTLTVHYVGVGQQSGKEFDSSWARGETAQFPLNQVIPGWTQGLTGMKVGGRRELVIPGALAYGANPPSADIAPDETLVFVVDLAAIN